MSRGTKLPSLRILRTDPLPLSSEITPTIKAMHSQAETGSRLVVLTQEQHERVWEIVTQCLPQKVADDPELHEAAARIASAMVLGPKHEPRPLRWALRIGAAFTLWVMSLLIKNQSPHEGD